MKMAFVSNLFSILFNYSFWCIFLSLIIISCIIYLTISNLLDKKRNKKKNQIKFKIKFYNDMIYEYSNEIVKIRKEIRLYSFKDLKKIDTAYLQISELQYQIKKLNENIRILKEEYKKLEK